MKQLYIKGIFYVAGLLILSLGSCLVKVSDLGMSSWYALFLGLNKTFGLTPGIWGAVICAILLVINSLLLRRKPDLSSVITVLIWGSLVDFWLLLVFKNVQIHQLVLKVLVLLVSIFLTAFGVVLYLKSNFSKHPIDNFMLAMCKKFGLNLMVSRIIGEAIACSLALLFNGPISVATIFILLTTGPVMQYIDKQLQKLSLKQSNRSVPGAHTPKAANQ